MHSEVHLYEREHAAQAVVLKGIISNSDNHWHDCFCTVVVVIYKSWRSGHLMVVRLRDF